MGRRARQRWVKYPPDNVYFSRDGRNIEDSIVLTVSEFEAMRLKHYVNFNQKDAAEKMGVSQPTFSRMLERAHQKVTQALYEGKSIHVHGGNIDYKTSFTGYGCLSCNNEWEDAQASKERIVECPKCESKKVYYLVREHV